MLKRSLSRLPYSSVLCAISLNSSCSSKQQLERYHGGCYLEQMAISAAQSSCVPSRGSSRPWRGSGGTWCGSGWPWCGSDWPWCGSGGPWCGSGWPWCGSGGPWCGSGGPWRGSGGPWCGSGGPWCGSGGPWCGSGGPRRGSGPKKCFTTIQVKRTSLIRLDLAVLWGHVNLDRYWCTGFQLTKVASSILTSDIRGLAGSLQSTVIVDIIGYLVHQQKTTTRVVVRNVNWL